MGRDAAVRAPAWEKGGAGVARGTRRLERRTRPASGPRHLQVDKANKGRNAALVKTTVKTYRDGVEAWMRERAAMLGFGTDVSLSQLDLIAKVATRTAKGGDDGLPTRRRGQRHCNIWWPSDVVRAHWEALWRPDQRCTTTAGLTYVAFDGLLDLDAEAAAAYSLPSIKAHWQAVRSVLIGAQDERARIAPLSQVGSSQEHTARAKSPPAKAARCEEKPGREGQRGRAGRGHGRRTLDLANALPLLAQILSCAAWSKSLAMT